MKRATPSARARAASRSRSARAHAAALPVVDHGDGGLGRVRPVGAADEARDADALARLRVDGGERLVVVVVDVGEVGEVGLAELGHRREEALVARLGAEALEARAQPLPVVGAHRAHDDPGAVAKRDGGPGRRLRRSRPVEPIDAFAVSAG